MCASLQPTLDAVVTAIDTAAPLPAATALLAGRRDAVHRVVQSADIAAPKAPVSARVIGTTGWSLFSCASNIAGTTELLLVGKFNDKSVLVSFFSWVSSTAENDCLQNRWLNPDEIDATVDLASTAVLKSTHKDKHFGKDTSAAQFTIGTPQTRKAVVAGMEQKAVNHGLRMSGEAFFKFTVNVGTDGQRPQAATNCIRVDTPGDPTQHSHPIPENQSGTVSHDGKVKSAILSFTVRQDLINLVALAKYLTIIGSPKEGYKNLKNDAVHYGEARPPLSYFWKWGA